MQRNLITLVLSLFFTSTYSQTAVVHGIISTKDNESPEFANIYIKSLNKGTSSDKNGKYELTNIPSGEFLVEVSLIGYQSQSSKIVLTDGQKLELNFTINEEIKQLQSVEIIGRKAKDYKSDYSFAATKMEMKSVEIPQSISTVTKELIKDQQSYRLNDVVKNAAGVNQFSTYDDITMRGFRNYEYRLLNGMRFASDFWSSPLLVNIERVEFLKGPSSALFSNSNPGGSINMVTKKPLNEKNASIDFATGSFGTMRTTADFTGPLSENKDLLYRLNMGYEDAGSFRDGVFNKTAVVAPSITFLPTDKTRVNFDLCYTDYQSVLDRGRPTFKDDENLLSTPIDFNLTQPGDILHNKTFYGILSVNHDLTSHITVNASFMKHKNRQDLREHGFNDYVTNDSIELYYTDRNVQSDMDNLTLYLTSKYNTGTIEHQTLVGSDFIKQYYLSTEWWAADSAVGGLSLKNPEYFRRPVHTYTPIIDDWSAWEENYYTMGAYLQHLLKWNKLQVMLGLRWDRYITPNSSWQFKGSEINSEDVQEAILPRIGLVYNVLPNTNIYATYNKGYQPVDPFSNSNPRAGGPFLPLYSSLIEGGFKGEYFKQRLLATLSVYDIEMNNVLVSANEPGNPDLMVQRGQEKSSGFEIEAVGKVTSSLQVMLNYAYNDARITKGADETEIGLIKENAPNHISGSWIKYTFNSYVVKGLGIALGHSHTSDRRAFANYSSGDYLMFPSYVVFNAALSYQYQKFKVGVNLNNLTNKTYWTGGYNFERNWPGAPRNFLVSVGYVF